MPKKLQDYKITYIIKLHFPNEKIYTDSGAKDVSGNKGFTEQFFHQKLMKTNRRFPEESYSPFNNHRESYIVVRRGLFVCSKVGSLRNI